MDSPSGASGASVDSVLCADIDLRGRDADGAVRGHARPARHCAWSRSTPVAAPTPPPVRPIAVLVVERDPATRAAFVDVINATADLQPWGAAEDVRAARLLLAGRSRPDVAVIDLAGADEDGLGLIAELATGPRSTRTLVVTTLGDAAHVIPAFEAGVRGYLLEDGRMDEVARAIRMVHEGDAPLSPRVATHLLSRFVERRVAPQARRGPDTDGPDRLSLREREVLELIAQGYSVGEIALRLHRSHHTVTAHVKRIYAKLAVTNRMLAVNRGRATGQIT